MKTALGLRNELTVTGGKRKRHALDAIELRDKTIKLLCEAHAHPEVSMAEAARLLGFERRATAYELLKGGEKSGR